MAHVEQPSRRAELLEAAAREPAMKIGWRRGSGHALRTAPDVRTTPFSFIMARRRRGLAALRGPIRPRAAIGIRRQDAETQAPHSSKIFVKGDQPATARGRERREIGAGAISTARIAGGAPVFQPLIQSRRLAKHAYAGPGGQARARCNPGQEARRALGEKNSSAAVDGLLDRAEAGSLSRAERGRRPRPRGVDGAPRSG